MENGVALGATGTFIIKEGINIIKPLIPVEKRVYIPVIAVLSGVLYGLVTFEGPMAMRVALGMGIGSSAIATHEVGKVLENSSGSIPQQQNFSPNSSNEVAGIVESILSTNQKING